VAWTSRNSMSTTCDLYYCLLAHCEALRTCYSDWRSQQSSAVTRMWWRRQVQPSQKGRAIGTVHYKRRDVVAASPLALRSKCDSPRTGYDRVTPTYMWGEKAIIEWSRQVISIVACCYSVKLCALAARAFDHNTRNILPCLSHGQHMKMTRDEHVLGFGFKS